MGLIKTGILAAGAMGVAHELSKGFGKSQQQPQQPAQQQYYQPQQPASQYRDRQGQQHQSWCNGACQGRCAGNPPAY